MSFFRGRKKGEKYNTTRISHSGFSFSSKLEAAVYDQLKFREVAKEISDIKCQVTVKMTKAKIGYRADFEYIDLRTGQKAYAEAKGYETEVWGIKKRLWKHYGPAPLEIWKGSYKSPKLIETVIPNSLEDCDD